MRRLAILDPLGDAGIGGYTHELAQALARARLDVDVYTTQRPFAERLPRAYALVPVFGGPALDAAAIAGRCAAARDAVAEPPSASAASPDVLDRYFDVLARRHWPNVEPRTPIPNGPRPVVRPRHHPTTEAPPADANACGLAAHLCAEGYDTVWTQWPQLEPYDRGLRAECADAGLHVVHTVHNVLPHERNDGDAAIHREVYAAADALVVHSRQAADALAAWCPALADRIVESRHGTYTFYPRVPGARQAVRARLDVTDDDAVVLLFGGIRPYKNVEGVLESLRDERCRRLVVVIAGWECGYDDAIAGDRLGRMRRLANQLEVTGRVRLLPGPFGVPQTSALFEAADVIALPYHASSGSGVLCLGLTFQRYIVCTETGGMAEYLRSYPDHAIIRGTQPAHLADALVCAANAVRARERPAPATPPALHWDAIVSDLLLQLDARHRGSALTQ